MNFNTILIIAGGFLAFILIIENMIQPLMAFVLIWQSKSWILSVVSIFSGMVIGFGLKGLISEKHPESYDDGDGF